MEDTAMKGQTISSEQVLAFQHALRAEEQSAGTIEKYLRDVRLFTVWLAGQPVNKERTTEWKEHLVASGYAPVTINSMISALNRFLDFLGYEMFKVKLLHIQKRMFREDSKELTKQEYCRLIDTANQLGKERLALLIETMGSTGIRVSEVRYITIDAARSGKAEISLKGKIRVILLSSKLCRKLLKFAKRGGITAGEIFRTRTGAGMSRKQIWAEMKALCAKAGISASKVFPHNLRHLFARSFYRVCHDIVKLADVLGHTNTETTRIYLVSTGAEHINALEHLGLVS